MKTINKLFLPLLLTCTTLSAIDKSYSFIGIQTDYSKIHKNNVQSFGLKYGQQINNYRTSLSYAYATQHDFSYQNLMLQIDTGIFKRAFKELPFKPYVGISLGVMEEKDKTLSKKDRGYLYGVNTGIAFIANDSLDFDLGYRYLKTHKLENIDEINNINLSMHYFY